MKEVAALFVRPDSIYKTIEGVDCWDIERDARKWLGNAPIIAHPPCRAWGQLRAFAKPRPDEKELAIWVTRQIQKWGGVLEHPKGSTLWKIMGLPEPGEIDSFGGFTIIIPQYWFGHLAMKETRLYIVGIELKDLPQMPLVLGEPEYVVSTPHAWSTARLKASGRKEMKKSDREKTPPCLRTMADRLGKDVQSTRESLS